MDATERKRGMGSLTQDSREEGKQRSSAEVIQQFGLIKPGWAY